MDKFFESNVAEKMDVSNLIGHLLDAHDTVLRNLVFYKDHGGQLEKDNQTKLAASGYGLMALGQAVANLADEDARESALKETRKVFDCSEFEHASKEFIEKLLGIFGADNDVD